MIVRAALRHDYAQWRPLWDSYNAFYDRHGATALSEEIVQTTWARFFDSGEAMHCLVAQHDGRLVGLAHYLFHRSLIAIEPVCYLQDLFILSDARGQGVGRALIEAVAKEAQAAKSSRLYWHTHETNVTAQALYDKLAEKSGFIVYRKLF
jgi:GNAT superfamily N-acetyltransferase